MTLAEKLRFLADRIEDEQEFHIGDFLFKYQNEVLMEPWDSTKPDNSFMKSHLSLDWAILFDFKLKPQWEFTEDEKVILRNLPDNYQWIARDESYRLFVYDAKPVKASSLWWEDRYMTNNLIFGEVLFKHLFQSIQWSDKEPCEFRKYLEVNE